MFHNQLIGESLLEEDIRFPIVFENYLSKVEEKQAERTFG